MTECAARLACPADEEGIGTLLRLMREENGIFKSNEDKVRALIRSMWNGGNILISVVGPIGAPIATMALTSCQNWYSDQCVLGDVFMFVHPDHRKSGCATALLNFAKKCSDDLGKMPMTLGIFGGRDHDRKIKLYERRIGPAVGTWFMYNRPDASVEGGS